MQADRNALFKVTKVRHTVYEHQHFKPMSTKSVAQLISVTLYGKRFFPYYTFNLVAGIDENGAPLLSLYNESMCLWLCGWILSLLEIS